MVSVTYESTGRQCHTAPSTRAEEFRDPVSEVGPGAFRISSPDYIDFIVEGHSELTGDTREPQRVLLNFFVDDLLAEQTRLEHADVEFIARAEGYPGFGLVSTFLDPDGNYCQLMELESD